MIVQHSGDEIVCGSYRMYVTGKMQVDVFHRNQLRVAAACSAALYSEYRTQRRLSQRDYRVFSDLFQRVSQTY